VNDPDSTAAARAFGTPKDLFLDCTFVGFVHVH
jgi:hypothetical protein